MSSSRTDPSAWSPELALRVEEACNRFEAAWRAGDRPRIEEYLGETSEPGRSVLLRELLALELEYRLGGGDDPTPEEYDARFPGNGELIREVLAGARTGRPPVPSPGQPCPTGPYEPADTGPERSGAGEARDGGKRIPSGEGRAGRFTPLRKHAQGGLGTVSVAFDETLRREVALKEIRPDRRGNTHVRRRFLAEAEITGLLEHPGVVPIYALEEGADGEPYYAMRFVRGGTLSEAIQAYHGRPTPLAFHGLLKRFLDVCQTIAYAHSRGVIHRDLKPANVLLGDFGETLVVDWGLAKRIGGPEAQARPGEEPTAAGSATSVGPGEALTEAGQVLGTPAYMPPEQAEGRADAVAPATDVYALGAILYELLTGQAPYRGTGMGAVLAQVRQGPPPTPAQVRRGVPRALEAVCLRAMARSAADRYPGGGEVAREVERWLADEPVTAYHEPLGARVSRWVRRNRTLAAAAVVFLLLALPLAVALAVVSDQARRQANTDRERIAGEQQKADKLALRRQNVSEFYEKHVLAAARPKGEGAGRDVTLKEALDSARGQVGQAFADQPEDEAAVCAVLGKTYFTLGEYDPAEDLLRRAVGLRRGVMGEGHPDTVRSWIDLTDVLMERHRNAEAMQALRRLLPIVEESLGKEDLLTLTVRNNLIVTMQYGREEVDLVALWNDLFRDQCRILGENHEATVMTRNSLGWALLGQKRHAEAQEVFAALVKALDANPDLNRRAWMYASNGLGRSLVYLNKFADAEIVLSRLLAVQRQEYGPAHRDTLRTQTNLGRARLGQSKYADAERDLREVARIYVANYGEDYQDLFMYVYPPLIQSLNEQGKREQAESYQRKLEEDKRKHREKQEHENTGRE